MYSKAGLAEEMNEMKKVHKQDLTNMTLPLTVEVTFGSAGFALSLTWVFGKVETTAAECTLFVYDVYPLFPADKLGSKQQAITNACMHIQYTQCQLTV